jgi:predicted RNase H-like HicB family nuclease
MATIEFTIKMNCRVGHDEDSDVYVSHCPTLDIYSQGESEEEALEAIKSAVTMHLTTAYDFNRLEKVLRRAGFERIAGEGRSEEGASDEAEFVRVRQLKPEPKFKDVAITLPLRLVPQLSQYASACQV